MTRFENNKSKTRDLQARKRADSTFWKSFTIKNALTLSDERVM